MKGTQKQMNQNYNKTLYACFTGYIVQAIVNNFVPLLFLASDLGCSEAQQWWASLQKNLKNNSR